MNKAYLLASCERAIKTAAQTAIATIGTTATIGAVDWVLVGSTTGVATILSVLTSLGSIVLTEKPGPAAFGPEKVDPSDAPV